LTSRSFDEPRARWLRQMAAWETFGRVASVLARDGIPILPIKGLVTSRALYDEPPPRLGDIDVELRPRDFALAQRRAREHGWFVKREPVMRQVIWKVDEWEVDVKCAIGPPGLCRVSVEDVMARAVRATDPLGVACWEPEINDHALVLAINAFKDGLRSSPWALEDLRRIARHRQFDSAVFAGRAREGRVATAMWVVADWLEREHDAAEWGRVRDRIGERPPSPRVAWTYDRWRSMQCPPKLGLFVVASASDEGPAFVAGLGWAAAGVAVARAERAWRAAPAPTRQ
jgi:hypothetical protein